MLIARACQHFTADINVGDLTFCTHSPAGTAEECPDNLNHSQIRIALGMRLKCRSSFVS